MSDVLAGPASTGGSGGGSGISPSSGTPAVPAAKPEPVTTFDFQNVVQKELEIIRYRRQKKLKKTDAASGAVMRGPSPSLNLEIFLTSTTYKPGDPLLGADRLNLTGLSLSGGGIRSAAVSLGVLQGIDSLFPQGKSGVIDRLDYLSTVSGGNYLGTSVAAGMCQGGNDFPFESKTDGSETVETRHLRDYSSYLIPNGFSDVIANLLSVVRGIVANLVMMLPILLLAAALTIFAYPDIATLSVPPLVMRMRAAFGAWPEWLGTFVLSPVMVTLVIGSMIFWTTRKRWYGGSISLTRREQVSKLMTVLAIAVAAIAFIEWQPSILLQMLHPPAASGPVPPTGTSSGLGETVAWLFGRLGQAGYVFGTAAVAFLTLGQKLLNIVKATLGDASLAGRSKRYLSKAGLFLLGLSVPMLMWIVYLNLSYLGICALVCDGSGYAAPDWLVRWGSKINAGQPVMAFYIALAFLLFSISLLFSPNANSLHQLYRDRLSRAFLMEREKLRSGPVLVDWMNRDRMSLRESLRNTTYRSPVPAAPVVAPRAQRPILPDDWTFSSLKNHEVTANGAVNILPGAEFAPYLLVNTAINLQAKYLRQRGRNADIFTLGPLSCGSDTTGYVLTKQMEDRDPRLTLGSGMAISGAAASANMGGNTIPLITFSLAALNVRLGYWLPNPRRINAFSATAAPDGDRRRQSETGIAPWYLLRELFGWITDTSRRVHLTDGGHIENLGIYELLKRRCRVIVAVDAEADQGMAFPSLIKAQLLTRIDHGIRIELPWQKITAATKATSTAVNANDETKLDRATGPHVAVGRIIYRQKQDGAGEDVHGVIIYIKSSLSGDENDMIQNYKRRFSDFPHETTLDQFFTEEQFEVYRALGYHMARGFFKGEHDAAFWTPDDPDERQVFFDDVRNALVSIAVPDVAVDAILARAVTQADKQDAARRPPPPPRFIVQMKTSRVR